MFVPRSRDLGAELHMQGLLNAIILFFFSLSKPNKSKLLFSHDRKNNFAYFIMHVKPPSNTFKMAIVNFTYN